MARVEGGAVVIDTDWPGLKAQIDNRNVNFKYEEDATAYEIFAIDGQYFYSTIIYKSGQAPQNQATFDTWRTEFETSYKNRITDFNSTQPTYISNVDGYSVVLKDGASPTANDGYGIAVIASDGTNYRMLKSDTSGRPILVGAGVAGTPAGGILSIQGVAGGTVLPISGSVSVTGSVTTTNASVGSNASAIPTSSTQVGGSDGTNLQALRVFDADTGGGTQYVLGVGLRKSASGGSVDFGTSSDPIRIDPTGTTTQPISGTVTANAGTGTFTVAGTVTANIGTTNGLALDATLTGGTQTTRITDGTNTATVKAASTAAVATDKALVVAVSPNNSVAVTGTFFQATQPVSGTVAATQSGTWTVQPGNTANTTPWLATINQGGNSATVTASNALKVDGSAVTQPISGTVTANAGTGNFTNASIGAINATLPASASVSGFSDGTNTQAARVFDADTGGGTQYVQGVNLRLSASGGSVEFGTNTNPIRIDPTGSTTQPVSGTVAATQSGAWTVAATQSGTWTVQPGNTANTTPWLTTISQGGNSATVTASNALKVDGSAVTQPVSGTVTANIGTTNGLALDATLAKLTIAQGTALGSNTQVMVGGSVTTAAPTYTTGQISPLSLTTTGALRTDSSGTTQPISGTITANAGTGNFTVVQSTASNLRSQTASESATGSATPATAGLAGGAVTTAAPTYTTGNLGALSLTTAGSLRVDGSGTTQPVSGTVAATQSGAWTVTANAGTGNFSVIGTATDNTSNSTAKLPVMAARANTSAPTWSDGNMVPLSVDTSGSLRITGSISATNPSVGSNNAAIPTSSTQIGGSDGTNLQALRAFDGDTGAGTQYILGVGLRKFASGGTVELGTSSDPIRIDPTGTTTQPVSGTVTANIGTSGSLALEATQVKLTIAQGTALGANTQAMVGGSVTTAAPTYTTGQISPLSITTAGALRTDSSGTTQPVSGTVTANAGTGNFTVVQATAANLKAQTASESTIATSTGTVASLIGGAVTTAAPTYTTGQMDPLSLTTAGALRVDSSGVTQPVSGTVTSNQGTANTLANGWPVKVTDGTNTMPTGDVVSRAIFHKITDGTNTAAVKAASTAAVAGDPALVVSVSPNTPITVGISQTDVTASGTLNALNTVTTVTLAGTSGAGMQLAAGTLIGTIVPEISFDGGTTWVGTFFDDPTTNAKVSSIVFGSNNTATSRSIVGAGGASNIRVRVSAFTSGTATCNLRASTEADPSVLYTGAVNSATQPPTASQIAGFDGTFKVPAVKSASTTPVVGDQALVVVLSPNQQAIPVTTNPVTSTPNIAAGYVITSAVTKTAVIASTYLEQTTNAQRSFKSASANDTSAGTGARTILLTYYDQTLAGPFTETITMNGTAAVNTVSTTICYVESIIVATAGSTNSNVGIISMFTTTAGGGSTMATVNATENRTFWGNHYVATGKTCYITGLSGHNTNSSNGSVLTLTVFNPSSANQVESQISDFVRVGGGTSQPVRDYNQLIKVVGPNRVRLYEACEGTASITTRAAFDFYDQ